MELKITNIQAVRGSEPDRLFFSANVNATEENPEGIRLQWQSWESHFSALSEDDKKKEIIEAVAAQIPDEAPIEITISDIESSHAEVAQMRADASLKK